MKSLPAMPALPAPTWIGRLREHLRDLPANPGASHLDALCARLATLALSDGCPHADDVFATLEAPQRYLRQAVGDPRDDGYSALLIAWPAGHRTPLHDHNDLWGIELVLDGALEVEEFTIDAAHARPRLTHQRTQVLGIGDTIAFTGKRYVHCCRNLSANRPALSLHVYGGALDRYRTFDTDHVGRYRATTRQARIDSVVPV